MSGSAHPHALPQGTRLQGGKYAVATVLGQGGFALTYKGGDLAARKYVAVKEYFPAGAVRQNGQVFHSDGAAFEQGKTSFLQEAAVLARFSHPNIVRVLDQFEENGTAYVILEFLEGKTLGQRLDGGKKLDEWEGVMLGIKLAEALEAIHQQGVLHRDIKPENIILASDGRPVLIDFGTARAFHSGSKPMTQVLTAGYAPLEQYAANATQGPGTDIYALSATLYHAFSGVLPVGATDRALDIPLPPLRSKAMAITPVVANAVMCGLNLNMTDRPTSARQFSDMLQGKVAALPVITRMKPLTAAETAAARPPEPEPKATAKLPVPESGVHSQWEEGLEFLPLKGHTLAVNTVAFSPDGAILASCGHDRVIQFWNTSDGLPGITMGGHSGAVTCMAFSPDGRFILTGTVDGVLYFWNTTIRQAGPVLHDAPGGLHSISFCRTRRIFACGGDGEWSVRDGDSGQVLARTPVSCPALEFSPDGLYLAVGHARGAVELVSSESGAPIGSIQAHQDDVETLSFSPDGTLLATGGIDGFVRVWQVSNGQMLWQQQPMLLPTMSLAWSQDGQYLASAHRDSVYIWSREGTVWRGFTRQQDRVRSVAFSSSPVAPYQYLLASASRDRTVVMCGVKG